MRRASIARSRHGGKSSCCRTTSCGNVLSIRLFRKRIFSASPCPNRCSRLGAERARTAVRPRERQDLSASDLFPDAGRSEAPVKMTDAPPLFEYVLRFADSDLVLAQRLGEWVGKGPVLEEDIALTNV